MSEVIIRRFRRNTRSWLPAIVKALEVAERPLSAIEIARLALHEGWIRTDSVHPSSAVQNAIRRHQKAANSRGMRVIGSGSPLSYYLRRSEHPQDP